MTQADDPKPVVAEVKTEKQEDSKQKAPLQVPVSAAPLPQKDIKDEPASDTATSSAVALYDTWHAEGIDGYFAELEHTNSRVVARCKAPSTLWVGDAKVFIYFLFCFLH